MRNINVESTVRDLVLSLDTAQYASGEVLADTQELTDAVRVQGGTGVIHSILVQDDDDQGAALDIIILDANTSIGTENSAVTMADNDNILGSVSVLASDYVDMANSQHACLTNVGIVVKSKTDQSLFVAAVSRGTGTYTASGITLRFGILQD
jgi:hypothetical protein